MFTELPEECRPENLWLPPVRFIDREHCAAITNDFASAPDGYVTSRFVNTYFITAFADLKHVEFVDMFTGQLCLPPEMYLVRTFKDMAKQSPFVVTFQMGWRARNSSGSFSPIRTETLTTREFGVEQPIVYGSWNMFDWRRAYSRRAAIALNTHKRDANVSASTFYASLYGYREGRNTNPIMFRGDSEYIIYIPEEAHNVENE